MSDIYEICSSNVKNSDPVFECVSCGLAMHLTETCIGSSDVALKGIQALVENASLMCNDCIHQTSSSDEADQLDEPNAGKTDEKS